MDTLSDVEIAALLDCIVYNDDLVVFTERTIFDFASKQLNAEGHLKDPNNLPAQMPQDEYEAILHTITHNPNTFQNLIINNVDNPNGWGRVITVTSDTKAFIVYEGTSNGAEWYDNAYGANSNISDTPAQKSALEYANYIHSQNYVFGKDLIITGHSKGGNLAGYVSICANFDIKHCYAFDAQGFSEAFVDKYKNLIDAKSSFLTLISHEKDLVSAMLQGVWGAYYNVAADDSHSSIVSGHIPSSLFSFSDGEAHLDSFNDGRSCFNNEFASMFAYLSVVLREDDWEYLAAFLVNALSGGAAAQYHELPDMPEGFWDRIKSIFLGYAHKYPEIYQNVMSALYPFVFEKFPDIPKWFITSLGDNIVGLINLSSLFVPSDYYSLKVRDFSERHKQELLASLGTFGSYEWWDLTTTNLFYRVSFLINLEGAKSFNDYFSNLSNLFVSAQDQINDLFDKARLEDERFASELSSNICPVLEVLEQQVHTLADKFE